jgi:thiol-disulfide isomerase/thioredoxin
MALVDISKITTIHIFGEATPAASTNNNIKSSITKEALLMNQFYLLADQFKTLVQKKDMNASMDKIKELRTVHGKIVESFYNTMSEKGKKFTEEEYYVLSTLDSSMTSMRRILNEAELALGQPLAVNISNGQNDIQLPKTNESTPLTGGGEVRKMVGGSKLVVDNKLPSMVFFVADWCSHCKHFKPVINAFKEQMGGYKDKINILVTNDDNVHDQFGIQGFPTVRLYENLDDKSKFYECQSREIGYLIDTAKAFAKIQ